MKIFVEYAIRKQCRKAYLLFINNMMEADSNVEIYEGTDQTGLFVEIWNDCNHQDYKMMKQERKSNKNLKWNELNSYIEGGAEKLHIWHFTKIK